MFANYGTHLKMISDVLTPITLFPSLLFPRVRATTIFPMGGSEHRRCPRCLENGQPCVLFSMHQEDRHFQVCHLEHVHCEILKHYGSIQCESKKKKKITEATIVLCGYVGIHTCSDAREKKDLKVAFPVRFLWPAQFGKLREILNK